jgi:hypothetical protein
MKSLEELFNQISFSTILTTGRTGSDYLQGCLDNVPGVLTFSGAIFYYSFCDHFKLNDFEKAEPQKILELFLEKNINLFTHDSIDNKSVDLDITKFKENFNLICSKKKLSRQKFLFAVYLAYHITLGRKTDNIKVMVHHSHHVDETKRFLKDFKNCKLLVTIRDPRANLKSGIVNWANYRKIEDQRHFLFYIKRIREDLKYAKEQINEKFFLKLEEAGDISTKKKLSDFLNIEFNAEINRATYAGKVWSGDKLSQFNSPDGKYNKEVANNQWQSFFSKKDKLILNLIYKDYSSFGYKMERINWIKIVLIFFLIPLPFVFDKKIFSLSYYLEKNTKSKAKILEMFFYIKRILYFYKLLFKLG